MNLEEFAHRRGVYVRIADAVSASSGIPSSLIMGRSRKRDIAAARHECWRRLRTIGWSFPVIGKVAGVDHSTVISACRKDAASWGLPL